MGASSGYGGASSEDGGSSMEIEVYSSTVECIDLTSSSSGDDSSDNYGKARQLFGPGQASATGGKHLQGAAVTGHKKRQREARTGEPSKGRLLSAPGHSSAAGSKRGREAAGSSEQSKMKLEKLQKEFDKYKKKATNMYREAMKERNVTYGLYVQAIEENTYMAKKLEKAKKLKKRAFDEQAHMMEDHYVAYALYNQVLKDKEDMAKELAEAQENISSLADELAIAQEKMGTDRMMGDSSRKGD